VIAAVAGAYGALDEVEGSFTVVDAGTVGTDVITGDLSLDGGFTSKRIRLGTAVSYTIPYVGVSLTFTVGTLAVGDVYTFKTTAPKWDAAGLTAARVALAAQQKQSRSWLLIGDMTAKVDADNLVVEANAFDTANERFIVARAQVRDRLPQGALAHVQKSMLGAPNLTFAEVGGTGDTITRSTGSFVAEGFAVGDVITVAGSVSNNVTGPIASLTATVITLGTTDLAAEGPVAGCTIVGSAGLTFAEVGATGDTITRTAGSWLADGFRVGDTVTITGTASNNVSGAIAALSATVITFNTTDLAAEVIGAHNVTCVAGETMPAWVTAMDTMFSAVDDEPRLDLGLGRARKKSPITAWRFRRPAAWAISLREYKNDLSIASYRKSDGKLEGWDLEDVDGDEVVEFDERSDGGALAGRFSCLRTYANDEGAFVALSLTRALEGSLLSRTHNMAVANLACGVVQAGTENFIGQDPVLKDDGTAEEASLVVLEEQVNSQLAIELLGDSAEGRPRASDAKWTASRSDVFDVPGATLTGVLDLRLKGTIEKIATRVRVH
jgi:hypothetical protein